MEKYTDLLRVPAGIAKRDDLLEELIKYLTEHKNAFGEIVFFLCETHDVRGIDYVKGMAARFAEIFPRLRKLGYRVGVNVLSTVGHHAEIPDPSVDGLDFQVCGDGSVNRGRLCPSSEKDLGFISDVYSAVASCKPDIVYLDDDLDYAVSACVCDKCLKKFEDAFGDFAAAHLAVSRDSFYKLMRSEDFETRKKFRLDWEKFVAFNTENIVAVIGRAVHGKAPDAEMGYMSCEPMKIRSHAPSLARHVTMWRPGGGLYTDKCPVKITEKADSIARQIKDLPPSVNKIQSEIENFPYLSFAKSVAFTELESIVYLFAGCTGTAFNVLSWQPGVASLIEFYPYMDIAKRMRPFAEEFVSLFGRRDPVGIGSVYTDAGVVDAGDAKSAIAEDAFLRIGLPVAYKAENMKAKILTFRAASAMTDAEITEVLGGGVFIDCKTLALLNGRGFGKYTGFECGESYVKGVKERDEEHFINETPTERNICLEFGINGHSEFERTDAAVGIVKTDGKAEYVTRLINYAGEFVSYASGIFENALGGRIFAGGYAPYVGFYSAGRMAQLKNIFSWLSHDCLPAYIVSPCKAAVWSRGKDDVRIAVANLALDPLIGAELAVKDLFGPLVCKLYKSGKIEEHKLKLKEKRGNYGIYVLPPFDALGARIIVS